MSLPKDKSRRVSLACIPCRSKHVKCGAELPICSRCISESLECHYAKSKRGGRARKVPHDLQVQTRTFMPVKPANRTRPQPVDCAGSGSYNQGLTKENEVSPTSRDIAPNLQEPTQNSPMLSWKPRLAGSIPATVTGNVLIERFYSKFHKFHPFLPPKAHLSKLLDEVGSPSQDALLTVIQLMGSLFQPSGPAANLGQEAARTILQLPTGKPDPIMIHCHLLYSIFLFWTGNRTWSKHHMDTAISIALGLGLQERHFARTHCRGHAVLEESWRRTWWQLYIIDAFFAATKREPLFTTQSIIANVDLPCDENDYEAAIIPPPKTLAEFNNREFAPVGEEFSSFAYLIGATRSMASAMAVMPMNTYETSSYEALHEIDVMLHGWLLHVPASKAQCVAANWQADELMFQAYMAIHATIIAAHRPFSALLSDVLEDMSSCSLPQATQPYDRAFSPIHTARCLDSIEAQVKLMTLPRNSFSHSPFTACMLVTGVIPLLSACKFVLSGRKLSLARDKIHLAIGCLKSMAESWPVVASNVEEVQVIARGMLGIGGSGQDDDATPQSLEVPEAQFLETLDMTLDFFHNVPDDWILEGLESLS